MLFPRTLIGHVPSEDAQARVSASDLTRLADLHALLFALDDPTAALGQVAELCQRLPVLESRILVLARKGNTSRRTLDLRTALSLVGNRGLERVLLELLEDLTVLKSELEHP
jgi:hypothetical protein